MKADTEVPPPPLTPPRRKRLVMTKADWQRVEQEVRKSERTPDAAQLPLLEDAS